MSAKKSKIIGFSPEQAEAARKFRETVAKNTPAEILAAFFPDRVRIGDIELKPIDLQTFLILEKVGNPIVTMLSTGEAAKFEFRHLAEALLLISLPEDAADEIASDREKLTSTVFAFAKHIPATDIVAAGTRVREHIQKAFETAVPTAARDQAQSGGGDPLATSPAEGRS